MIYKKDDFIPLSLPIELIKYYVRKDVVFFAPPYSWNKILLLKHYLKEENYYLCKQRCPRCLGSIFIKDQYIKDRFYCEKCNYNVQAIGKLILKDIPDSHKDA
jgi:ribosomal protein S27AE